MARAWRGAGGACAGHHGAAGRPHLQLWQRASEPWKRKLGAAAYRSEFAGMVGSMETMASSVVRREMVVFLEDRHISVSPAQGQTAPAQGP